MVQAWPGYGPVYRRFQRRAGRPVPASRELMNPQFIETIRLGIAVVAASVFLGACAVAPTQTRVTPPAPPAVSALIRLSAESVPSFEDDIDTASLRTAALRSLDYYQTRPAEEAFAL